LFRYNSKTYAITDVDFSRSANSVWHEESGETYVQYYQRKHGITITDPNQRLLASKPKVILVSYSLNCISTLSKDRLFESFHLSPPQAKDLRRGQSDVIYLVPEVCHLTGLSDQMRSDFKVMRDVGDVTRLDPNARVRDMEQLLQSMLSNEATMQEMKNCKVIPLTVFLSITYACLNLGCCKIRLHCCD
jgi:aubergine-like protein